MVFIYYYLTGDRPVVCHRDGTVDRSKGYAAFTRIGTEFRGPRRRLYQNNEQIILLCALNRGREK